MVVVESSKVNEFQWPAAILAGIIAGAVLLIVPSGSPWSGVTFFSPVIMGRTIPPADLSLVSTWLLHLLLSVGYGLVISRIVASFRRGRALLAGALMGMVLYGVNLGLVSAFWLQLRGNEIAIAFTHIVFGLVAAGAYRGLLKRQAGA